MVIPYQTRVIMVTYIHGFCPRAWAFLVVFPLTDSPIGFDLFGILGKKFASRVWEL